MFSEVFWPKILNFFSTASATKAIAFLIPAIMTDDLFDPLLDVENQFSQQGRTEGRSDGQAQGYDEGFSFGHSKSIELGKELGFYLGCVEMWFMLYSKYPERFHIR